MDKQSNETKEEEVIDKRIGELKIDELVELERLTKRWSSFQRPDKEYQNERPRFSSFSLSTGLQVLMVTKS